MLNPPPYSLPLNGKSTRKKISPHEKIRISTLSTEFSTAFLRMAVDNFITSGIICRFPLNMVEAFLDSANLFGTIFAKSWNRLSVNRYY